MKLRTPISPIRLVLALHAIAGCIFSLSTPLFDVSDELRHVAMVEHYAAGRGLPVQTPGKHEFFEQEGSQPPLYYLTLAAFAQAFDLRDFRDIAQINPHGRLGRADATDNRNQMLSQAPDASRWRGTALFVQLMRLLGVACGTATVWAVWRCAAQVSEGRPHGQHVALLAALLTAFNPMFVFIQASVTNDVFVTLFGSLAFLIGLRLLREPGSFTHYASLGILLGLAILSKSSGLAIAAGIFGVLGLQIIVLRQWSRIPRLAAATAIMLAICGWWYARNWLLYGEWTGTRMMATIAGPRTPPLASYLDLIWEWDGFFKAYWGLFGAVNIPMHDVIYPMLSALCAMAGVGLLVQAAADLRRPRFATLLPGLMLTASLTVAFVALCVWTAMTLASQGRLLFPVIVPISVLMALGLARVLHMVPAQLQRLVAPGIGGLGIALAVLTVASPFLYVQPAYRAPPRLAATAPPVLTRAVELQFGDDIRWLGYRVAPQYERLRPGESFEITLYWQALKPISQNYSLFIKLFDPSGSEVARTDATPGGGLWQTRLWQPGEIIEDRYRLVIDGNVAAPGVLRLDAGFYTFDDKVNLPSKDARGQPTGRQRFEVAGVSPPTAPGPAPRAAAGFAATPGGARAGDLAVRLDSPPNSKAVQLTTIWRPHGIFDRDYTIFAQLLDARGNIVGQADGRPMNGDYGTRWWQAGDTITDVRLITPTRELPASDLTLLIGLYDRETGERVAMFADPQSAPTDALRLPLSSIPGNTR